MYYLLQHNGKKIPCKTWKDIRENLTGYVSPKEFARAQDTLSDAASGVWCFVLNKHIEDYGFHVDRLYKEDHKCGAVA